MEIYTARNPVEGEAFRAWGEIIYSHPLTEEEMWQYELKPSRKMRIYGNGWNCRPRP